MLVALSGGPDSSALLSAMLALQSHRRVSSVAACHVDHHLRADSALDAEFCAELCAALGVPLHRVSVDVSRRGNVQSSARRQRYLALGRVADAQGATAIVTGHTRSDQAETVMHRLLRGSGARGLAAIPARRGRIVRPLLERSRAEVLAYLGDRGIAGRGPHQPLTALPAESHPARGVAAARGARTGAGTEARAHGRAPARRRPAAGAARTKGRTGRPVLGPRRRAARGAARPPPACAATALARGNGVAAGARRGARRRAARAAPPALAGVARPAGRGGGQGRLRLDRPGGGTREGASGCPVRAPSWSRARGPTKSRGVVPSRSGGDLRSRRRGRSSSGHGDRAIDFARRVAGAEEAQGLAHRSQGAAGGRRDGACGPRGRSVGCLWIPELGAWPRRPSYRPSPLLPRGAGRLCRTRKRRRARFSRSSCNTRGTRRF